MRNDTILVGARGRYRLRAPHASPETIEVALSGALGRWGFDGVPWGPSDSGTDVDGPDVDSLRGWVHYVAVPGGDSAGDLPLQGLFRGACDTLAAFGELELTGLDAVVPAARAGEPMWRRTAGSVLRERQRASEASVRALVQAAAAWGEPPAETDAQAVLAGLSELVRVRAAQDAVEPVSYPPAARPQPFVPPVGDPLRAEVALADWSPDAAAWLAEALCISCCRAGVTQDLQLAVRLLP